MLRTLAFDADDTLWRNEPCFAENQEAIRSLRPPGHVHTWISDRLHETWLVMAHRPRQR